MGAGAIAVIKHRCVALRSSFITIFILKKYQMPTIILIVSLTIPLMLVFILLKTFCAVIITSRSTKIKTGTVFYYKYGYSVQPFIVTKVFDKGFLAHCNKWLKGDAEFFSYDQLQGENCVGIAGRMHPILYHIFHW